MGQTHSEEAKAVSPEQLSHNLALRFLRNSFSEIEIYSFKDNFRSLANTSNDGQIRFWTEDTLTRFLAIPDSIDAGQIIHQSATYLGAFPFPEKLAPSILTFEALVKVVVLFTGRYKKVIKKHPDTLKLLFRSFAVYDRRDSVPNIEMGKGEEKGGAPVASEEEASKRDDEGEEDDDDDDLSLAALEALDAIEVFHHQEKPRTHESQIPVENMIRLVMLLLLVAPLEPKQPIATSIERFNEVGITGLRQTAENVVRAFKLKNGRGVVYRDFKQTVKNSMPYLFDGLSPLFEHFLFSKNIDMSGPTDAEVALQTLQPLISSNGKIMNTDLLCQLGLFMKGDSIWRRLRLLYAGSEAGFSMGAFETKVLKWQAPTILLVSGTRISDSPETSMEKAFIESLSSRKYPVGDGGDGRVVFGVYLNVPWRHSHKDCFGDSSTLLFQLEPRHEVFRASTNFTDYAHFNKTDGLAFGNSLPKHSHNLRDEDNTQYRNLGPVSLTFDHGLEFGVFNHMGCGGGAYHTSMTRKVNGGDDWQDRFQIEEIEVWGCGGDKEAEEQRKMWAWEEREALLRRNVNLGKDIEADRALLEMAGLVGQSRSGGSMG